MDRGPNEESVNDTEREEEKQRAEVSGEPSTRAEESEEHSNESDDYSDNESEMHSGTGISESEESAHPEEETEQSCSDIPLPKTRATRK